MVQIETGLEVVPDQGEIGTEMIVTGRVAETYKVVNHLYGVKLMDCLLVFLKALVLHLL